jgi:LPS O-antigen subunit length determinant protein (WzzB/FepE family)
MTTANDMKTRAQLDDEIADLKEALTIAVEAAAEEGDTVEGDAIMIHQI